MNGIDDSKREYQFHKYANPSVGTIDILTIQSRSLNKHKLLSLPTGSHQPQFPVPKVENVYKAWKPVDHGHPLRDATIFYSPPTLERVMMDKDKTER